MVLGLFWCFRRLNGGDDRIDLLDRFLESLQDVSSGLCLFEVVLGPADHDFTPMLKEEREHLFKREQFGLILVDGQENDSKRGLHLGMLEELVENDLCDLISLELNDN